MTGYNKIMIGSASGVRTYTPGPFGVLWPSPDEDPRAMRDTDHPALRGVSQKALPQPNETGDQYE